MKKRLTRRVRIMLGISLRRFPELRGKTITVGYTRANLGSAIVPRPTGSSPRLMIRLKVPKLTYNTIGHELTHLVQGLSQLDQTKGEPTARTKMPSGEKQCDIWTLARSQLFCDDAPGYLKLPRSVRENWPYYAHSIRALCIAAIKKRETHRFYIRWLESQIRKLAG
jgi:hypothetical protein